MSGIGIEEFRDEIAELFAVASGELETLPEELRGTARALLERSDPLRSGGGKNAISFLLPYWLGGEMEAPRELCRDMAVGNLYAMLQFFVLDDAMDGGTARFPEGKRKALALGQLLLGLFRQRYARWFPYESALWAYEREYAGQWASAVCREASAPVDPRDRGQLAGKAAPVKLCAAGLSLWTGKPERIADLAEAVDLALAVLQLSDDWADWREDLAEPNRNAFLTLARDKLGLAADGPLDERLVARAIYRHGVLNRFADIAQEHGGRLRGLPGAPRLLREFQEDIERGLRAEAQKTEDAVQGLASQGGLSHFLSESVKK